MVKCACCHKGLNSTYIKTGYTGSLQKIGPYCNICNLHYSLDQKPYTVNEKLYTVSKYSQSINPSIKYSNSQNITQDNIEFDNNYNNFDQNTEISQIARPRFELGSKAPKASMLGHYTRHL